MSGQTSGAGVMSVPEDRARQAIAALTKPSLKAPIAFGLLTVLSFVLFVVVGGDGVASFVLSPASDAWQLPPFVVPARPIGIAVVVVLAAITGLSVWVSLTRRKLAIWVIAVFGMFFLFGFLTWATAASKTATIPVVGLLAGAVSLSVPLIFGSLAGVIGERVGVVNIAIEGQLLSGAFAAAIVSSLTQNPWVGLIAAGVGGTLVAFVLASFSIKYLAEQVIVGVVINVFVIGLTNFLYSQVLQSDPEKLNTPVGFERWDIPLLSQIPVIGPVLFRQTPIVYLAFIAVAVVAWGLFRTRWGLRLRAVGEHPTAADTVGINVARWRFWNVALAGALAGMGGAFYTLSSVPSFGKEMTAGAGYIALAAVIFGKWNPILAALAALLFGFSTNLQSTLSIIGSPVPSQFMQMLPYVVTILAVAGFVGGSRPPAASGKPYIKA